MTWIVKRRRIAANQYLASVHDWPVGAWVHAQSGALRLALRANAQAYADVLDGRVVRLVPKKGAPDGE